MDVAHFFGSDLNVSATGGLVLVDGLDLETQRIIRRLMTAAYGYTAHIDYGAGVPQQIGGPAHEAIIRSIITSQIFKEDGVAKSPAPQIDVAATATGTVTVTITYTESVSGKQNVLSFDISR